MAINFPNSPQLDDTYTEGNRSWRWNGVYWRATSATVGYTGSKGDQGESFRILGSVATVNDLPADSSGLPGDGYIIIDTGDLYVWDGFNWNNNGRIVGYTGSRGVPGASVKLLGSVATEQDLPTDGTSDGSTLLVAGEAYIVQSSGNLFVWNGSEFTDVGKITGETGPIGYTGSAGFTGSVGFVGSRGESTFTWGDTAPENPDIGARWYDTITGCMTVYVDDGDSQQWAEVNATGFLGQTGYTGSSGGVNAVTTFPTAINSDVTIAVGENGLSVGPLTQASGTVITIAAGQRGIIL